MLLGLDIGVSVVKAALFAVDGSSSFTASLAVPADHPAPGRAEKDAGELWRSCSRVIREVIDQSGGASVSAAGICACGNGCVLLDAGGKVLRPVIFSSDTRAVEISTRWQRGIWADKLFPKTRQRIYPGQTSVLLRWIRDHEPDVYSRIDRVMLVKDFIRWKLTGEFAGDFSDLGATGLFNLGTRSHDPEILAELGLSGIAHALPPARQSTSPGGTVTAEAAEATGLPQGLPVAVGCLDCEAALLGGAASDKGTLSVIAGSWSINQTRVAHPPDDPSLFLTTCGAEPNTFTVLEGSPTSALNFEWHTRNFHSDSPGAAGGDRYDRAVAEAMALPIEEEGPLYLPFLHGSPDDPTLRASFLHLSPEHGRADFTRAVLEGIVFGHAWHLAKLRRAGLAFDLVRLSGGASRNPSWVRLFADILGLPVAVGEAEEIGALGAAICAGVAVGRWPSAADAARTLCREKYRVEPDAAAHRIYTAKFHRYLAAVAMFPNTTPNPQPV